MEGLLPQALYSNRIAEEHHARAVIQGVPTFGPCDITDYDGIWRRAAKRIEVIDPDGREAYAVLRQLQLEATRTSSK